MELTLSWSQQHLFCWLFYFHFLEKHMTYWPLHSIPVIHVQPQLCSPDATCPAITTAEKILEIIENFLDGVCFSSTQYSGQYPPKIKKKKGENKNYLWHISSMTSAIWIVNWWFSSPVSINFIIDVTSLQQLPLLLSCMPMLQWRGAVILKLLSCCGAITCRVFMLQLGPWDPLGPALRSFKYYMRAVRDWCLHWVPLHL